MLSNAKASTCRELLKRIKSLTFLIQDNDVFDKLEKDLRDNLEDLKLSALSENGLVKEALSSVRSFPKKKEYLESVSLNQDRKNPV